MDNKTAEVKTFDMMSKEELIDALLNYKRTNPAKFERDKEALFEKYGLKAKEVKLDEAEESLIDLKEEIKKAKIVK